VIDKIIEEKSISYISKRVAQMNGDIRVAFDMLKEVLVYKLKNLRELIEQ